MQQCAGNLPPVHLAVCREQCVECNLLRADSESAALHSSVCVCAAQQQSAPCAEQHAETYGDGPRCDGDGHLYFASLRVNELWLPRGLELRHH